MYPGSMTPLKLSCPAINVDQEHAWQKEESIGLIGQVSGSALALEIKMIINSLFEVGIVMTSFSSHTITKSSVFTPE